MSDVDPGEPRRRGDAVDREVEQRERAENATGTDLLTLDNYSTGYITDEGVVAGIFWWNDPVYPANGDAAEFVRAQYERTLEAGMLGFPAPENAPVGGPGEPRQLEPA